MRIQPYMRTYSKGKNVQDPERSGFAHAIRSSFALSSTTIAAAAALQILASTFAPTFIGISSALFLTHCVVQLSTNCQLSAMEKIKEEACLLRQKYPKLKIITFIFSLTVGMISPKLGMVSGAILGTFEILTKEMAECLAKQQLNRRQMKKQSSNYSIY